MPGFAPAVDQNQRSIAYMVSNSRLLFNGFSFDAKTPVSRTGFCNLQRSHATGQIFHYFQTPFRSAMRHPASYIPTFIIDGADSGETPHPPRLLK
jgi:hypothetical protein